MPRENTDVAIRYHHEFDKTGVCSSQRVYFQHGKHLDTGVARDGSRYWVQVSKLISFGVDIVVLPGEP